MIHQLCSVFLFCLFIFACQSKGQQANAPVHEDRPPTRRELYRAFRQSPAITLVYGTRQAEYTSQYEELMDKLPDSFREMKIEIQSDTSVTEADLRSKILLFVGTQASNPWMEQLVNRLPLRLNESGFEFAGRMHKEDSHIFRLSFYPNPYNPGLPLLMVMGNDDGELLRKLQAEWSGNLNFFRSSWGYEISRKGQREILGFFSESDWQLHPGTHWDFSDPGDSTLRTEHFRFIRHDEGIDPHTIQNMAENCEATVKKIRNFLRAKAKLPPIDYHLYATVEKKGLMRNNTDQAHLDQDAFAVHTVVNQAYANNYIQKENELIINYWIGEAATRALQKGLAIYFTEHWQKKSYPYWSARLAHSGNALPLRELLDNERFEKESSLVTGCLSGSLVDFLLEHWGKDQLLSRYAGWQPTHSEIETLEPHWQTFLAAMPREEIKRRTALPYLKGFNFAHEGYQIYNGYPSGLAVQSLQKMADIGSNAAALIPYSSMRNPTQPNPLNIEHGPGGENDEGVVHCLYTAKSRGMTTVLKPQIWIRGGWPGDVDMASEAEWNDFFDYYHRWMRHYALLAEIHEVDLLSVGVEFAKATLQREADWRQLIRRLRGLYSGPLTYSANWGDEFEKMKFWDELDYIGLNCYYPLSYRDDPSKKELEQAWKKVVKKIEKVHQQFQKPILFTEIGFRSVDHPWKNPHEEANGRPFNELHQDRSYEVVFEGIRDQPWCAGILWWKWPSYLDYRGANNTGFSPNGKMAEGMVEKWFGGL